MTVLSTRLGAQCLRCIGTRYTLPALGNVTHLEAWHKKRHHATEASKVKKRIKHRMKVWHIHQYGGNEQLVLSQEAKIPEIRKPKEILVQIHAASVNPIDVNMRDGYGRNIINQMRRWLGGTAGPEFPLTLGRDFSGVIKHVGLGVTRFKPGDEVWGAVAAERQGTHAQFCITAENEISKKPTSLSHIEAASIPYVAATDWAAIVSVGELNQNNTYNKRVLVHGGAGGIGTFAIQLLKAWGAVVVTTCSTDAVSLVKHLGADEVIDYRTQNVVEELLATEKLDFVLDCVGDKTTEAVMKALKPYSKFVTLVMPVLPATDDHGLLGGLAKSAMDFNYNSAKGITKGLVNYRWAFFTPNGTALKQVAQLVDGGKIQPVIDKVFAMDDICEAYEKVGKRKGRGKTVIDMS